MSGQRWKWRMKKKHLGNEGRMWDEEEVRISRLRGEREGRQLGRSCCLPGGEMGLREAVVHLHLIHAVVPSSHRLLRVYPDCLCVCVCEGWGGVCRVGCVKWLCPWTSEFMWYLNSIFMRAFSSRCMFMSVNVLCMCVYLKRYAWCSGGHERLLLQQSKSTFVKSSHAEGLLTAQHAGSALQRSAVFFPLTFTNFDFSFLSFFGMVLTGFYMSLLSGPYSAIYIREKKKMSLAHALMEWIWM